MFNTNKFKAQMVIKGYTMKKLSQEMDMNESTLYRKLQHDGSFTRQEINNLIKILEIENANEIFFADELA